MGMTSFQARRCFFCVNRRNLRMFRLSAVLGPKSSRFGENLGRFISQIALAFLCLLLPVFDLGNPPESAGVGMTSFQLGVVFCVNQRNLRMFRLSAALGPKSSHFGENLGRFISRKSSGFSPVCSVISCSNPRRSRPSESVSICVHPWLNSFGCGSTALRLGVSAVNSRCSSHHVATELSGFQNLSSRFTLRPFAGVAKWQTHRT